MPLKLAIIGTRGIPNRYGGFEELAQHLAAGLAQKGYTVTVYNSHRHPYRQSDWNGVSIAHCYDAEHLLGTAGQFIYDLNCIRHARKQKYDVILLLGYTSSSVWGRWYPKEAVVISNMDGLEWKREKYSGPVRRFLQYAEKLAVRHSHHLVADSPVIQQYLLGKYNKESSYIPYGANINDGQVTLPPGITAGAYYMLMARMEPENNIEMILDGFRQSQSPKKFVVVGSTDNRFGRQMVRKFKTDKRIIFTGAIYDSSLTHGLRHASAAYFHGHSVGGTNPSLLEAMADKTLIVSHDNPFNRAVLQEDAYYFKQAADIKKLIENGTLSGDRSYMVQNNFLKISRQYNWPAVTEQYHQLITNSINQPGQ